VTGETEALDFKQKRRREEQSSVSKATKRALLRWRKPLSQCLLKERPPQGIRDYNLFKKMMAKEKASQCCEKHQKHADPESGESQEFSGA
jgi:hypothetical protein